MNKNKLIGIAILVLLIMPITFSVSFLLTPRINDNALVYTGDDLTCSWILTDTTNQTINWYKDGTLNKTTFESGNLSNNDTIPNSLTSKGEEWTCEVILYNATHNTSSNSSSTIKNTAPSTPILLNNSVELTGIIQVIEDQSYTFYLNSSDDDNDTLTYPQQSNSYFCEVQNTATGELLCEPTQSDLVNNNYTQTNMTFWVNDQVSNPSDPKAAGTLFAFNITPINDAPIAALSNQTINLDVGLNQDFPVSDEEGDTINATLDLTNTDAEIAPDVTVSMNGANINVQYLSSPLDFADVGNRTISINVSDDQGAWHLQEFVLTINTINRAPRFVNITPSGPYVIQEGENLIINITANDTDIDDGYKSEETLTLTTDFGRIIHQNIDTTANTTQNSFHQINFTPTSAEVGVHNIQLTISDGEDQNTTTIQVTVTNINQAPIIYNESYYSENTLNNFNNSNLTAYVDSPFIYKLNWTDPDLYLGDVVALSDNTSLFNIQGDGTISFTPNSTQLGTHSILITADDGEEQINTTLTLEVRANARPYYNQSFSNPVICDEKLECYFNLSYYAKEDDANDNVSYFSYSLINSTNNITLNLGFNNTGFFNFTPVQNNTGNYTFRFIVYDTYGANNTQEMNLTIKNVNDVPIWERYDFSSETIVENKSFNYQLRVSDEDLLLAELNENITVTSNISFVNIEKVQTINDTTTFLLSFTPNSTSIGTHEINLTATDNNNTNTSVTFTFTVLADTDAPTINNFQPYGNISNSYYYVADFKNTSGYSSNLEIIRFLENTSDITFEIGVSDDVTPNNQLTYEWFYDNVSLGVSINKTNRTFDFYESGSHNLTVRVNDTTLESTTWTWLITVENVNQEPILANDLWANLTIDQTTTYTNYFQLYAGEGVGSENKFFDADDDLDENGIISGSEELRLTYTATSCGIATIVFEDDSLKLIPTNEGICQVIFTATDDENASISSNTVNITVLSVPSGDQAAPDNPVGGGGGGSSSSPIIIPISNDVEVPKPLKVISPEVASIYENRTIKVPITISNNWSSTISGIQLTAELPKGKENEIIYSFSTNYIEKLETNQSINTTLTVTGYRLGENFEIKVMANSSNPEFGDEALILFNSIEKGSDEKEMEAKVTFAQDLLSENSECQELAELLDKGKEYLQKGDLSEAAKYIDVAINGCKYLISKTRPVDEKPSLFNKNSWEFDEETLKYFSYLALIIGIIVGAILITVYHFKDKEEYDF